MYFYSLILSGYLSYAEPQVLEKVAERRITNGWQLTKNYQQYDVLLATPSCDYLNHSGLLLADGKQYSALVVDCAKPQHRRQMVDNRLLADVNDLELVHCRASLILN